MKVTGKRKALAKKRTGVQPVEIPRFEKRLSILTNTHGREVAKCRVCLAEHRLGALGQHGTAVRCACGQVLDLVSYQLVSEPDELEHWLAEHCANAKATSFDYETLGLNVWHDLIVGVSFCPIDKPGFAVYVPVRHRLGPNMDVSAFESIVGNFISDYPVVPHNADFEYRVSVVQLGVEPRLAADTMILAWLDDLNRASRFDPRSIGLKEMSAEVLSLEAIELTQLIRLKNQDFSYVPPGLALIYGAQDSDLTTRLYQRYWSALSMPCLSGGQGEFVGLEHDLIDLTARMELAGVRINAEQLQSAKPELQEELIRLEDEVVKLTGRRVNLGSNEEVADLLFRTVGVPIDRENPEATGKPTPEWPAGQPSTSKKALGVVRDTYPEVDLVMSWREVRYALDNYIDKLPSMVEPVTGMLHCRFNQLGTPTARYSSSGPNLQSVSKARD